MTKTKELTIFNKFKLGDKVWYEEPMQPFRKRIPGIVEKDKIQTVGKRRDEYITSGVSPFIEFIDLDVDSIKHRRKEFPGETNRIRLHHMGMEREYIDWKKKDVVSPRMKELLHKIKNEGFQYGAHEAWYINRGFTSSDIQSAVDSGLIHRQKSSDLDRYILVPKGETYR